MRLLRLNAEIAGERLGHTLYDKSGRVLLQAGTTLNGRYIDLLARRGYLSVPVYDPLAPDAVPMDVLHDETRQAVNACVEGCFDRGDKKAQLMVPAVQRVMDQILADLASNSDLAYNVSTLRSLEEGVFVHSVNVCVYSLILAASLALNHADLRNLGVGALLHDIGKMYYMELVNKPGKLTAQEYALMQRHAADGYELLRRQPGIHILSAHVAYQHHERLDGSGYPRGLTGDRIHLWAQLAAVADVYDTVTSDRFYGLGRPPDEGMAEIGRMAEEHKLEPRFVRHLTQRVAAYPEGSILLLESGEVAVVIGQSAHSPHKPRIRTIADAQLRLIEPVERVADGSQLGTTIHSVLADYPLRVKEQMAAGS